MSDDEDDPPPAPADLMEALERSEAQARAGVVVSMEEVLAEFDADLAAYEAARAVRETAEAKARSAAP